MRVVLVTAPSRKSAEALASGLIEERLAACVTRLGPGTSYYRWKGRPCRDREYQLVIKTKAAALPALIRWVKRRHEAQTPEIIALPVVGGAPDYLAWLEDSLP